MMAPSKAGRYELLEEIGRGAMGVVYKAHDPVIGRSVAVKSMRLSEAGTGLSREELTERFQTEARAAGLLAHSNIVVVYDAGEEGGLFYITMEYIEGRSVQALLDARQSFPLPRVLRLMEQACSALEYAHQRNVVHRDIKPANLMVTSDDTLKITDFGTAKILQFGTAQTAHVMGTPSYMSPEQVKGKAVDGRSDVFSLGVILYELVTGEKPFPGQNITTVIYKIINEDPIPPRELDSSIHPGLSYVVLRALAKEPQTRFQSAQELMDALRRFREFETATIVTPVRAPSPAQSSVTRFTTPPASRISATLLRPIGSTEETEIREKRGHFWLALFLLAIIAGASYRLWPYLRDIWQRSQGTSDSPTQQLAPLPQATVSAAQEPSVPAENTTPVSLAPATAAQATPPPTMPAPANTTPAQPAQTQPAEEKLGHSNITGTTPPNPPAAREPEEASARNLVGLQMKSRIEQRLAQVGLADKVQVSLTRNTVTLTGRLTPREHRVLLFHLRSAPSWLRFVDNIEYVSPGAGETPVWNRRSVPQQRE